MCIRDRSKTMELFVNPLNIISEANKSAHVHTQANTWRGYFTSSNGQLFFVCLLLVYVLNINRLFAIQLYCNLIFSLFLKTLTSPPPIPITSCRHYPFQISKRKLVRQKKSLTTRRRLRGVRNALGNHNTPVFHYGWCSTLLYRFYFVLSCAITSAMDQLSNGRSFLLTKQ